MGCVSIGLSRDKRITYSDLEVNIANDLVKAEHEGRATWGAFKSPSIRLHPSSCANKILIDLDSKEAV